MKVPRCCVALCTALMLLSTTLGTLSPAYAQADVSATLTGIVRDPSGAASGDARVTASSATLTRSTITSATGAFTFSNLPPDTYTIVVTKGGFNEARVDGVTTTASAPANITIPLVAANLTTIGHISTTTTRPINTTPAAISTIDGSTYVQQGQTQVMNVLDQTPGVEVQRFSSGAPGANTEVAVRGAAYFETQTLIDGHPVSSGSFGAYNTTFLNSLLLDRIEVVKGPGGFPNTLENAVGGTVNFVTPRISTAPTGDFLAGFDSFNGDYFALKYSQSFGKLGVYVGYARSSTPGYFNQQTLPIVEQIAGPTNSVSPIPFGTVTGTIDAHQGFDLRAQLAKLAYNFTPQTSVTLSLLDNEALNDETGTLDNFDPVTIVSSYNTKYGPQYTAPGFLNYVGQTINGYYGYGHDNESNVAPLYSGEFRTAFGQGTFLARYYTGSIQRIINQTPDPNGVTACGDPTCSSDPAISNGNYAINNPFLQSEHDILHGFDATYTVPIGAASVALGFDSHSDFASFCAGDPQANAPDTPYNCLLSNGNVPGTLITSKTYSIRAETPIGERLDLSLGGYLSNTTYVGNRIDPRAGLVYRPNQNAAIRVSYGSAYVAPFAGSVINEAYVSPGYGSNPATLVQTTAEKPETSASLDVGTDVKLDRDTRLSFDAYNTRIFNRFSSTTITQAGTLNGQAYGQVQFNFNESNAREAGLELAITRAPRVGLGFNLSGDLLKAYAYNVNSNNVGNVSGPYSYLVDGAQLGGYPFSKERGEINYAFKSGLYAAFGVTAYGQWNAFGEPGFAVFDTSIALPVSHGFKLRLGGSNLFNHDNYRTFTEYQYGYATNQGAGSYYPGSLYFYQPRTLFLQLERKLGS